MAEIARQYPPSFWPGPNIRRDLEQRKWREYFRVQREQCLAAAAFESQRFYQGIHQALDEGNFLYDLSKQRRTIQMLHEEELAYRQEINNLQGNDGTPLGQLDQYFARLKQIEDDTTIDGKQKDRRTEMLREALRSGHAPR